MHNRQRPLLVPIGRGEDPPVEVVQPRKVAQLVIFVGVKTGVVRYLGIRKDDAPFRAQSDGVPPNRVAL